MNKIRILLLFSVFWFFAIQASCAVSGPSLRCSSIFFDGVFYKKPLSEDQWLELLFEPIYFKPNTPYTIATESGGTVTFRVSRPLYADLFRSKNIRLQSSLGDLLESLRIENDLSEKPYVSFFSDRVFMVERKDTEVPMRIFGFQLSGTYYLVQHQRIKGASARALNKIIVELLQQTRSKFY